MTKNKTLTILLALAFAASIGACKKDKDKKEDPAAAKPAAEATDPAAAKPMAETPPAAPEGEAKDEAGEKVADLGGLEQHAVPGQSLQGLDGVAQFSLGDGAEGEGCAQYGKDIASFFNSFAQEFKALEQNFSPDANGVAAMRKFSGFLKQGITDMKGLNVTGDRLQAAHGKFVGSLEDLAGGFDALADGIEAQDQGATQTAAGRVQNAVNNFKSSINELVSICGE